MLKKITSSISMPISLSGASSKSSSERSKSSREREHDSETLKWLNDRKRRSNEYRDIAADRLADARPGDKIVLDGLGLSELPDHLLDRAADSSNIKLAGNSLCEVPRRLLTFQKLQRLDLSTNKLRALPTDLGSLSSLRKLDVSHNRLSELPQAISVLTKLKLLAAGNNALEYLPKTIGNLTKLENLSLGGNLLTDLPEELKACANLETLDLSSNHFSKLPEVIGLLGKLQRLLVSDNDLADEIDEAEETEETEETIHRAIPESVGRLENLREFDVSGNPLTFLPNSFTPFKYASKKELKIRKLESQSLFSPELEIRIANTPLPVELNKDGRLPKLATVPAVRYRELYQPPSLREESDDEDNFGPPLNAFEEHSISRMARAMPEVLAAQTALGGNGQGALNELLRALGRHGGAPGNSNVEMPPVFPQLDPLRYAGAPVRPGGGILPNVSFDARNVQHSPADAAPNPSFAPGGMPSFIPGSTSGGLSGAPATDPQTAQHNAGPSLAQPAFAQPPAMQPPFAQPYAAQPYPAQTPFAPAAFQQPASASLFGSLFQPAPVQAAPSPLFTELFQRLSVLQSEPQRPSAYAAPLATPSLRKTLFDYSASSYADNAQYNIDMLGIRQIQQSTLAGLAELHRERVYLQGPHLEQRVQEAKALGNPKRDLWTLGVMMFRQHIICDLAGKVANINIAKKAADPGKTNLVEDPLPIALMFQMLVCRPNELQILGFENLRKHLDEKYTFRSIFSDIAMPEQYDFYRNHIMKEVRAAEQRDNGRLVGEFVNRQPFWQQFLREHQSAARASWVSAHGF